MTVNIANTSNALLNMLFPLALTGITMLIAAITRRLITASVYPELIIIYIDVAIWAIITAFSNLLILLLLSIAKSRGNISKVVYT